jgi:hypothetical protein
MPGDSSEVAITISAIDAASDVIQGVQSNLDDMEASAGDMSGAMGGMADSAGQATSALNDTSDSLDATGESSMFSMQSYAGLTGVMRSGIMDFERTEMMQLRIQTATVAVEKAQTAYNNAVAKYGENSTQALLASQNLANAQDRLNMYQEKSVLNYTMMATQIPMMISNVSSLVGGFGALSGVFGGASDAVVGFAGALGPVGIAIIAIVAVVAILYEAWTHDWGGIREIVGGAVKDIQDSLSGFVSWLGSLGTNITTSLGNIGSWLKSNWQDLLIAGLTGPVGIAMEAWKNNWGGINTIVTNALSGVKDTISTSLSGIGDWFGKASVP